jgi:hypothetical protein
LARVLFAYIMTTATTISTDLCAYTHAQPDI